MRRNESEGFDEDVGIIQSDRPRDRAHTTAEVDKRRRTISLKPEALRDFAIHLLEHRLAIERTDPAAVEPDMHVQPAAPVLIVESGLFIELDDAFGREG